MKFCPVCGVELRPRLLQGIEIDQCPKCGGVWLDGGELNKLLEVVRTYKAEYYGDPEYQHFEERYRQEKKKKSIFEFFEDLFD